MIFLKNIMKKSTIKWYIISLISIIIALLLFWSLNNYLNLKQTKTLNQPVYRTIIFEENDDILDIINHDNNIEEVSCDLDCTLVVKEYRYLNVVEDILNKKNIKYEKFSPPNEEQVLFKLIDFILPTLFISFIIIFSVYVFQFISDDILTIRMLRTVGYSKLKILQKYLMAFLELFNIIFFLAVILFLIISFFLKKYFIIKNLIITILSLYLFTQFFIIIIITFKILSLSKKSL